MWGEIEDQNLSKILESGKKIPIEEVLALFGEKKFYDSQPITEYIMEILWQVIFTERKSETEYDNEFILLAREVYILNDHRAEVKRKINESTNSLLIEEKQYVDYGKEKLNEESSD